MARMIKKTLELDQDYVDRARRFFGVKTEKQAVNKALELVAMDDEILQAHREVGGKGTLVEEVFE
jgi:Arc/MetJ family transcription regulator